MKTARLRIALALLLITSLTFAFATQTHTANAQKTTITFWNGFTGPDRAAVEALVKGFNDSHPNIQVNMEITPWDSLMQNLLSTMSVGQGPDVVGVHFQFMPQYAKSGYLMDLSDQYKAGTNLDPAHFPKALVDLMQYNGKFYAAPANYATLMMYYNKDIFKAAGLDPDKPPTDWSGWFDALRKTTDPSKQQYGIALGEHETIPNWPILIWANGGDVIKDGKAALTDPKTVEALKIWSDLLVKDKVSPIGLSGADADKLFQSGKAAMEITGPWAVNGFKDAKLNFDVAPIPTGPGGAVTLADTVVMMVNKNTKSADAVTQFIQYWNGADAQATFSAATGFPPTRTDMANNPAMKDATWSQKFAAVSPVSRFYLGGQEKFTQIDNEVFIPMIQKISQGQASVEDAAKQANDALNSLLTTP